MPSPSRNSGRIEPVPEMRAFTIALVAGARPNFMKDVTPRKPRVPGIAGGRVGKEFFEGNSYSGM